MKKGVLNMGIKLTKVMNAVEIACYDDEIPAGCDSIPSAINLQVNSIVNITLKPDSLKNFDNLESFKLTGRVIEIRTNGNTDGSSLYLDTSCMFIQNSIFIPFSTIETINVIFENAAYVMSSIKTIPLCPNIGDLIRTSPVQILNPLGELDSGTYFIGHAEFKEKK